ncbi:gliding motility-associated C-terminal domain-containing protein [Bernardetia sp.]|uniref:gliding motility-associated C-terminal domain-containing protein n=1 Tax=Bernardetia sp. TaxID=1937974 RepID=UPI0025BABC21|nr:gliding motility-associated C-terminal domain-containing protein [Bernardetia sp.]
MTTLSYLHHFKKGTHFLILLLFFAVLFLSTSYSAYATHIVGGELEFTHIQGNRYRIGMVKYFDAVNGNPGAIGETAKIGVFSKRDDRQLLFLEIPRISDEPVPYTDPDCAIGTLLVRRIYYAQEITLDRSRFNEQEGYYMVWERCCRNNIISNIIAPENAGLTMYLEFPALVDRNGNPFINSAPQIFPPLSDYVCVNQPFFFDFSGADPDGDELRYRLTVPINGNSTFDDPRIDPRPGPYSLVEFVPGITLNNMVPGSVPLSIDQDGIISLTASQTGLYVFAIAVDEFRNGVKIGEVRRDYQLLVIDCPTATKPNLAFQANAEPNRYVEGTTIILDPNEDRCGNLLVTDSDPNTVISARVKPINFTDGSGILLENGGNISGAGDELSLGVCFPKCPLNINDPTEPYIMDFIVADNSCAVPLLDTIRVNVLIRNPPNDPPTFVTDATFDAATNCYIKEVVVGNQLVINTTADDPNGDSLQVNINGLPAGASYTGQTQGQPVLNGQLTWTPDCNVLAPNQTEQTFDVSFTTTDQRNCDNPSQVETCLKIKVLKDTTQNRAPDITTNLTFDPTTNQYVYDSVFVGEVIDFNTLATDPDGDSLSVEFVPQNFNASGRNISYSPLQGIGSINSNFSWQTSCEDLNDPRSAQTFVMNFNVTDYDACGDASLTDQIQVRVVLLPRPNIRPTIRASLVYDSARMTYYDTLTLGEPYRFTLTGDDANGDSILITGNGVGFNFAEFQMQFTEVSGRPVQTTDFVWNTSCEQTNIPIGEPINLKFQVTDFNECESSLDEEIDVQLIVLPPDPNNTAPEAKPEITTFNDLEQVFVDTVFVGDAISFDVLGLDAQRDSVLLYAEGVGFDLSDFNMTFPQVNDFAPVESTFDWQTLCEYLGEEPVANPQREFLIDFIIRDFNECQESLEDTTRVKLVLLYERNPNRAPEISANLTFDAAQDLYIRPVRVDEFVRFNVTGEDADNSVLSLEGRGVDFNFTDLNMNFEDVFGTPTLTSEFTWQPLCSDLGFQNADTSYIAEFIVTDIANCDIIYTDTIRVRFDLTVDSQNTPPSLELQNTDSISITNPDEYVVRIGVGQEVIIPTLANDVDGDKLALSARGVGFNLSDLGMQYENKQGFPVLESDFSWTPECDILEGEFSKEFKVIFTASDTTRCGLRASTPKILTIIVEDETVNLDFTPANVFTPNGDGKNDTFYIPNLPQDDCNDQFQGVEIYNRWGQLLFESTDRNFEWDGGNAISGQYYFLIKYRNKTYKNWLTILRD